MSDDPFSPPDKQEHVREIRRRVRKQAIPRQPLRPLSKQAANYALDIDDDDDVDRLRIPRDMIPDGMDYQWVTDSIMGQPAPQRRARFEKKGWVPVPASRHDGFFMPKGAQGEINVEGLVLMERPLEVSLRARKREEIRAIDQVRAKEAQLTGGNIPGVGLDTRHESALRNNRVRKSYERGYVPDED